MMLALAGSVKADLHGTVFSYDRRMLLLLIALLAGHENGMQLSSYSRTPIKRPPPIKRPVTKVPKLLSV